MPELPPVTITSLSAKRFMSHRCSLLPMRDPSDCDLQSMMRKSGNHFFENIMLKLKKKPHHVIAEAIPLRRMMLEHDVIRWTHLRRSDFGAWAGVRRKAYRQYGRGVQGRRFPGGRVK